MRVYIEEPGNLLALGAPLFSSIFSKFSPYIHVTTGRNQNSHLVLGCEVIEDVLDILEFVDSHLPLLPPLDTQMGERNNAKTFPFKVHNIVRKRREREREVVSSSLM